MTKQLGVAVIGAGMAGRSHANGYRQANTIHGGGLPPVRLIAIADINQELATEVAGRYGFEKAVGSWQEIADDPEIDVVSVVVGNSLHREVVGALLAAGKHVLCEKPLADTLANAEAMVAAAEKAGTVAATAYSFRRNPAVEAIRDLLASGELGDPILIEAHYLAEYVAGPIVSVAGADFTISIKERNLPLGNVIGHDHAELSDEKEAVTNDDSAVFTATFANGAAATFRTSRVAYGPPNDLALTITGTQSRAVFDWRRPAEFVVSDNQPSAHTRGDRVVYVGPGTAAVFDDAVPMPGGNISFGYGDLFVYQIRAFLDQVLGRESRLPACATLADGLHTMKVLDAVTRCYHSGGARTAV